MMVQRNVIFIFTALSIVFTMKEKPNDMVILIKTLIGQETIIKVKVEDTIKSVKAEIEDKLEQVPAEQQRLVFNGKHLEDEKTLSDYNVQNGSTIYVILRLKRDSIFEGKTLPKETTESQIVSGGISVFVLTITGRKITLEVDASDTVEFIKDKIEEEEGIFADNQRLAFGGYTLEDKRPLSYYDVRNGSTISLVFRLKGGGGNLPVKHAKEDNGPRSSLRTDHDSGIEIQREKVILEKIPYEFVRRVVTKAALIVFLLCVALGIISSMFSFR